MVFLELFRNDFTTLFPEAFLVLAVSALLLYGVVYSTSFVDDLPVLTRPMGWLSIQALGLTLLLVVFTPLPEASLLYGVLYHDLFTRWLKIFVFLGAIGSLVASLAYLRGEAVNAFEYFILVLLATLGLCLILSANDLLSMYLAIELQSLSLYLLAAFKKNSAFSTEAGLKYFILGAFSSGLLLFGSSLLYGFTGTTNFEDLAVISTGLWAFPGGSGLSQGVVVGLVFVGAGLLFKMAAAPFHMWSPDVYEGAPTSASAFFAIVPKVALFGLVVKVYFYALYDFMAAWQQLFLLASFASMVVGAFGALQQRKIKRLLAYSSIGHVGYMLIGVATGTLEGLQGLVLYLVVYMVMSLNVWTVLLSLTFQDRSHPTEQGAFQRPTSRATYLTDLTSLSRSNPLLALTLMLTMFSMSGMPPLAGFCAKMYIFFSAMEANLYTLGLLGVLTSCVGAFYYMRLVKVVFFEKKGSRSLFLALDREKSLLLGASTFFIGLFFAHPGPFLVLIHRMVLSLSF
jgi:proton-translocating NADH-quinone oxidoreductase chain N